MNGLLFPGQGSQDVGMGVALYEQDEAAKQILDEACEVMEYDLKTLMFNGPIETLTDTRFAQPAIYTCSAMYLEKVRQNDLDYSYVAGHSLGEYSALYAAGMISFTDGLKLVKERSEAMSRMNGKGTMAAVMGLSENELIDILPADVVVANLNSKSQIVISGDADGIALVGEKLKDDEKVKFKKLNVSAAFHSPQMKEASESLQALIDKMAFMEPACYVVSNVTGTPTKNVDVIKENLKKQITGQVRWYDTIISMKNAGVKNLYEVGFGDVLKKLNKTITFRPKCVGIEI